MTTIPVPIPGSNTLTTFLYEPFSYTISNPLPGTYTLTTSNTSGIPPGYLVNNGSNVVFSTTSNGMGVGTEVFTVTAKDGSTTIAVSSNIVNIGAGRFLDASSTSYAGRSFTFYKNEPITPLSLVAPFAISVPTSVPTLPPGLTYTSNDSNIYTITGTPLATVPQSNYLVIGKGSGSNLGKIVTSQFGVSVSNERVLINLAGSPIVSDMTIGTPISGRVITAAYPPYPSGGTLRYSWFGLPDGISVTDSVGNTQTSPFTPSDTASTIIITGTPTVTAANAYRDADITSNVVTFTATRTNPLPQISNSESLTFAFGETVLFDTPSVPTFYNGVTLDPSATSFRAFTYFGSTSPISNIFSPDLRADLSINFVYSESRGYLTGTPTTIGSSSYTIRAINSNAISRDLSVPITVVNDSVSFLFPTPTVDTCYNFVLSRPSSLALTGYYTSDIQFRATAASGKPVTFSAPALAGTGLSLSNVSSNTVQIVGTPNTVTPLTTATITASATGTPATASTTIKFAVLNDDISFSQPTTSQLSFVQNKAITPIQLTTTTLSGRPVISFNGSGMPAGVTVSTTGLISGAPTVDVSGSFSIAASTGFMSESQVYNYSITPDSVLFLVNPSYVYEPLDNVAIDINSLTYSGTSLSNFAFSGFSPTYGLSIAPSTGIISGTLIDGLPPGTLYSSNTINYSVTASAGGLTGTLPATFTGSNIIVKRSWLMVGGVTQAGSQGLYQTDDTSYAAWTTEGEGGTNLSLKNTSVDSNVYLIATADSFLYRSTNGLTWQNTPFTGDNVDTVYQTLYDSNDSRWYAVGTRTDTNALAFYSSSDDGLSWTRISTTPTPSRSSSFIENYYTYRGAALAIKDGVIMVGGSGKMVRSIDGGLTWNTVTPTILQAEIGTIEVSASRWIVVGSSSYKSGASYNDVTSTTATTINYSDDEGETWVTVASSPFDVTATHVVYDGSGTWLATGLESTSMTTVASVLAYSDDGDTWQSITLPGITFTDFPSGFGLPLSEVNSIWIEDSYWYVLVKIDDISPPHNVKIFRHAIGGTMTTGWSEYTSTVSPFEQSSSQYVYGFKSSYVRLGPTTLTLGFDAVPSGGPTVTSPTIRYYVLYQYIPITPITFSATGTGRSYFFIDSATLPRGLTFDPLTSTLSGTPVVIGLNEFTVYVKDDIGVTQFVIRTETVIPRVIRQQTSAGAWTSLIRQYTVVNAAQNSVNGRVLPATEPPLGEFMRPEPPDSVSASGDPNCAKKKC